MKNFICLAALAVALPIAPLSSQNAPAQQQPAAITKTAFLQNVDKGFVAIDANKDGFADKAEIESAQTKTLAALKAAAVRQMEAQFKALDKDNNGSLTMQEFTAQATARALPRADATNFLKTFDANKDGKVSLAERRTPAVALFDKADSNKDGQLSPIEQQAASRNR